MLNHSLLENEYSAGWFESVPKLVMSDFHTTPALSERCLEQPKMPFP
jgi:hypothetical protein